MSKKTIHLKESGLNAFLLRHAEKVGLAVAMMLAILFVLWAPNSKKSGTQKSPADLNQKITAARSHIQSLNQNTWEQQVLPERQPPNDYPERVRQQQKLTASQFYSTPIPFDPPKMIPLTKRTDPELFTVTDIQVIPATVCLAYNPTNTLNDPTANDEPATLEEPQKKVTRRPPRRRRRGGGGDEEEGLDMEEPMGMEEEMIGEGNTETSSIWKLGSDKVKGYIARPYTPDSRKDIFIAPGDADVIPIARPMITVVALAPYKRQFDHYKEVFGSAVSYDRARDKPAFLSFSAQRVDVTDDPDREIQENEWQVVKSANHYFSKEIPQWNGTAKETFVSQDNLDSQIVMPCPPIMMRDLKSFMWHPQLPLGGKPAETEEKLSDEQVAERKKDEEVLPGLAVARNKRNVNEAGLAPGMEGMNTGDQKEEDMSMEDMMGEGMMGEGMMGEGGGSFMEEETPVEHKLVRFYDFDVQPGHTYRYRIQLILEDPNNPNTTDGRDLTVHSAPETHTLTDDVRLRLQNLNDSRNRKFFRNSPWSDPTPPVYFPHPEQVLVSIAMEPKLNRDANDNEFTLEEPRGMVKTIAWDKTRAVDVPIDREVFRGSILNFNGPQRYAHPFTHVVQTIEEFNAQTNWFVADILGGELLPGSTKEKPLRSPGEFALIDSQGNLIIRNELDDADEFYRFTLEPKKELEVNTESSEEDGAGDLTGAMMEGEEADN
jgi:hypothetical protein